MLTLASLPISKFSFSCSSLVPAQGQCYPIVQDLILMDNSTEDALAQITLSPFTKRLRRLARLTLFLAKVNYRKATQANSCFVVTPVDIDSQ